MVWLNHKGPKHAFMDGEARALCGATTPTGDRVRPWPMQHGARAFEPRAPKHACVLCCAILDGWSELCGGTAPGASKSYGVRPWRDR